MLSSNELLAVNVTMLCLNRWWMDGQSTVSSHYTTHTPSTHTHETRQKQKPSSWTTADIAQNKSRAPGVLIFSTHSSFHCNVVRHFVSCIWAASCLSRWSSVLLALGSQALGFSGEVVDVLSVSSYLRVIYGRHACCQCHCAAIVSLSDVLFTVAVVGCNLTLLASRARRANFEAQEDKYAGGNK